ncbi:ABC transporter ATP-binding protein [Streptacidiphilus sp. PB12-B1b]|uniref:ABC transporter ATP-binding protein n=1 Tax=Streptacidiphilus sp. PB12-B1b TaxID=2705012 RepID=UPI0015FE4770|nr:ABC transporter ATP-binding protein [Streptacidiphilus sp. PB12-B1b]QMU78321.1 ABC transporter ATP-binding protein [Streptacidiphilus sp. PB12-B1b]
MRRTERDNWVSRLLSYCWRYRGSVLIGLAASLLSVALAITVPLLERSAVDRIFARGGARPVGDVLVALGCAAVLNFAATYLRRYHGGNMSLGVQFDLRTEMQRKLLRTDGAKQDGIATGQVLSRATSDLAIMQRLLSFTPLIMGNLLLIAGTLVATAFLSPRLFLVMLVVGPAYLLYGGAAQRKLYPATWQAQQAAGELAGVVDEFVAGVRVVKGLGQEERESAKFTAAARALFGFRMRTVRMTSRYNPALAVLPNLGLAAVLGLGGYLAMDGSITLGTLLAFVTYLAQLAAPVAMLSQVVVTAPQARAALQRIFDVIDAQPEVVEAPGAVPLPLRSAESAGDPELEFADVRFGYAPGRPVLNGFSLRVAAGETLALVGRVGSGKSTAALLLPRLFEVHGGSVRVRGVDVRELTLSSLRADIGLVPEESFLFSESIRDNIAFGKQGATDDEVIDAARSAGADAFIRGLPDGYETVVGEGGLTLSGGERQRVAIARALIGRPPILVLDDAMSAVDAGTEAQIADSLRGLLADRTVVLIAHRRSTLGLADRIAVLDKGKVVDTGTHDELLARSPLYRLLLSGPGDDVEGIEAGEAEIGTDLDEQSPWERPQTARGSGAGAPRRGRPPTADLLRRVAQLGAPRDVPDTGDDAGRPGSDQVVAPLRMRSLLRPFRMPLALLTVLLVLDTLLAIAFPLFVRSGINQGIARHRGAVLVLLMFAALAAAIAGWAVDVGTTRTAGRVAERLLYRLRTAIFGHVQRLGLDFHEREGTGRLLTRMTADLDVIASFAQSSLIPMAVSGLTVVAAFTVLVVLDPLLSTPLFAALPLAVGATVWFRRRARHVYTATRTKAGEVNASLHQSVRGARLSEAFDRGEHSREQFRVLSNDYRRARLGLQRNIAVYFPFLQFLFDMCAVAAIWLSVGALHHGTLSGGVLLAYLIYLDMLFSPTQQLSQAFDSYQQAVVGVRRISELLCVPESDSSSGEPAREPFRAVRLDLSFTYPGRDREVLSDIRMTVDPGRTLAIVGASGAGKSSLVKLIARFYEPTVGSVLIDGADARTFDVHSYRRRIVTVPQEPFLFTGTVRDTIAYCRPEATDEQVEAAAREVGAHRMIARLPGGYHHPVASRGENLSAGQRQLLALARAHMAEPDILLLDEATASLDTASEAAVTAAMRSVMRDRTTVLVVHRLEVAARADRIVLLNDGRITETGTHDQLMDVDGEYARLWAAQTGAGQHAAATPAQRGEVMDNA